MPLIYGIILLALAVSLAVIWWSAAFVAALQVLLVVLLALSGLIATLVGYSSTKAQRITHDATREAEEASEVA